MRDRVPLRLGGRDYAMLPTLGVLEAFEDRFGSIGAHVQRLAAEMPVFAHSAFLIWQAIKADPDNAQALPGGAPMAFGLDQVKAAMFEAGLYGGDLAKAEVELIERLIYTPEQHTEKKARRAAAEAEQASLLAALSSSGASPGN